MFFLTACGTSKVKKEDKEGKTDNAAKVKTITLSAGTEAVKGSLYYEELDYLAKEMEKRTDGKIKINIYPAQELGSEISMMEGLRSGSIDLAIIGGANLASVVPELQLLSVPYIFKDFDTFKKGLSPDNKLWQTLVKTIEDKNVGLKLMAPATIGSRWFVNTKGEVRTPDDIKKLGLKIRVQANPTESKVWSAFGGNPTNMPMPEVFTAMQQGVVSAVENAPDLLYQYKIHEVAKYFSATDHNWYVATLLMSDKTWNKIPEDLKTIVKGTIEDAGKHILDVTLDFQAKAIKDLENTGAVITTDVNKEAFRSLIVELYDEVAKANSAEDILKAINEIQ